MNFDSGEKLYFRQGKLTYLRPLLLEDLRPEYLSWLNNPELNIYSDTFRKWPTTENDLQNFYDQSIKNSNNIVLAICDKKTDKHIGNYSLNDIDWVNRRAYHSTNIGIKKYRSLHYIDSLNVLLEYAFLTLNLNKIMGGAEIPGALNTMKRFGYKKEGILKKHNYRNGEYVDVTIFAVLKNDYLKSIKVKEK